MFIFSKAQWNSMKTDMLNFSTSFLESYKTRSINQNWNDIKSCVESTMNANIPTRTISGKNHKPWLTSDIRRLSSKKHRLYKRAKRSGKPEHNQKFQEVKNLCSKKVKKTRVKYINRRVLGGLEDGNSKPFWSYIKSLRQEGIGIPSLRVGSTLYSAASDKARILISEFQSVFTREDTSFIPWLGPSKTRIGKVTAQEAGVRKLLSQLKPHKASGPDDIPNRVLKELSTELALCLTALFNQSLEAGTIPDDWSKASISPVFKKGSVHDAANYRPVSLTCVACKLLEHIVVKHMLHYLEEHKLLSSLQHGFRKGHSCETQLLITLDDFFMSYDRKIQTDVGILDFSRASDTVPHKRLLGKLASYGISGPLNSWIRAFLTGRTMSVTIDGVTSDPADVLSGVPQGTVLGPLLFLIYINDMPDVVSHGTYVRLFADDFLAYRPIHSDQDQIILQQDLTALQNWAERWGMRFNPKKCYIMHIHRSQIRSRIYQLCGEVLYSVSKAKYLGVLISNDLSWNEQVCKVAAKANTTLHFISRNLKHCPRSMRQTAYCSLTRSGVEYCSSVWDPHLQKDKVRLEKINRRAARVVFNRTWRDPNVSPTALLHQLQWAPLETRRYHQRMCLMYKVSHGLVAVPPTRLIPPARNLRGHTRKYQHISTTCDPAKFPFFPRSIPEWNQLDNDIVTAPSIDSFRSRLTRP